MELTSNFKITILIYLGACMVLYEMKPDIMFTSDGSIKSFGLHKHETVFPFWLVTTLLGFTCYYFLIIKDGKYVMN